MAEQVIAVHVSGWEIECCTPPPGVGDLVSWPLVLFVPEPPHGDRHRWTLEHRELGPVVVDGPVVAYWPPHSGPGPEPGAVEVTGRLVAVLHGGTVPDGIPPVGDRVRRVAVESQEYELVTDGARRGYHPVPGTERYREVARSPRWFEVGTPRHETGVICDLVVTR